MMQEIGDAPVVCKTFCQINYGDGKLISEKIGLIPNKIPCRVTKCMKLLAIPKWRRLLMPDGKPIMIVHAGKMGVFPVVLPFKIYYPYPNYITWRIREGPFR